ncbi:hypothetical protein CEUSTIGMA_g7055.t1 [Chlamydomonas eustigma]|uniref:MI domain-containing protein n=1 Tax=Chlamydomonas eustigma TaxID=1157962 RepID=A0A250X958_9CHLO|nr:hypothetical protein CEUSTIGMA_g7055.t1 [Chlamydomonas eustigma]|eukprot:GAX79614.1 hypothetical protein CEUSTIGMA_g7055.t1 [Chlamydomonas eustigma]
MEGTGTSGSFLNEQQRNALDAALKAKAAENAILTRAIQKSAVSKSSRGGGSKKDGGSGKFTWGSIFTNGDHAERILDRNDPNYDSDEERVVVLKQQDHVRDRVLEYKSEVANIVEEYFSSGDVQEVVASLDDLGSMDMLHYFVKRLLVLAFDRNDREREMACMLLNSLYAEAIPPEQVRKGFMSVIEGIEDTVLDVPDATELLSIFIARAVVDDVLPPAIISKIPDSTPISAQLKAKAEALLHSRHSAEKVLRAWGPGASMKHQDAKDSMQKLLIEYCSSFDMEEAARCLRSLSVPFFHHELVKQSVHLAMSSKADGREAVIALLDRLCSSGEISQSQLVKGLRRVVDTAQDMCLDNPAAKVQLEEVLQDMKAAKLLDEETAAVAVAFPSDHFDVASSTSNSSNGSNAAMAGGHSLSAFKAASAAAILEYFDSSDADEVERRLLELGDPGLLHIMVKQAVVLSLDRKDRERELVSVLLCHVSVRLLSRDQVSMGMTRLLVATDNLLLDCPDAVRLLSLFLGRAIVDEILPPSFLTHVLRSLPATSLGAISVIRSAGAMLSARHGAERLAGCWKGGALSLDQIKERIKGALAEYVSSRGVSEASRCLSELGVPSYHHEAVKQALELAFENVSHTECVTALLHSWSDSGVVNSTQMTKGFLRIKDRLDEEALDFGPLTEKTFLSIVKTGTMTGWLSLES